MPNPQPYLHNAYLCAYFETNDEGVPVFQHWGIYSAPPSGLTVQSSSSFFLERGRAGSTVSYGDAVKIIENNIEAAYNMDPSNRLYAGIWKALCERRSLELGGQSFVARVLG